MVVPPGAAPGPSRPPFAALNTEQDEVSMKLRQKRALEPFGGPGHAKVEHMRSIDPSKHPVPAVVSDDDELGHPPPEPGGASQDHLDRTGDAV